MPGPGRDPDHQPHRPRKPEQADPPALLPEHLSDWLSANLAQKQDHQPQPERQCQGEAQTAPE